MMLRIYYPCECHLEFLLLESSILLCTLSLQVSQDVRDETADSPALIQPYTPPPFPPKPNKPAKSKSKSKTSDPPNGGNTNIRRYFTSPAGAAQTNPEVEYARSPTGYIARPSFTLGRPLGRKCTLPTAVSIPRSECASRASNSDFTRTPLP
ncbi:hypothetical protein FA13DRAFT_553496 [Coprinellus micaceus]|uniref:Uncharacterized protein n=1 Tax=Coprinellus micaceus TaxID=71717 RepID=A0A4Y7TA80_COPMI|nr:hypothetical protein FA13DRAFT_553496 [Coprinellus micaceus]